MPSSPDQIARYQHQIDRVRQLRSQGLTSTIIAQRLGLGRGHVTRLMMAIDKHAKESQGLT